jgi:hypothetical protein
MGVVSMGVRGNFYATPRYGIRAQIQHLKAYANTDPLAFELVQPTVGESRFRFVQRGVAPYVEWLGQQENPQGRGWATGAGYGAKILDILRRILATQVAPAEPQHWAQGVLDELVQAGIISTPDAWNDFESPATKAQVLALVNRIRR